MKGPNSHSMTNDLVLSWESLFTPLFYLYLHLNIFWTSSLPLRLQSSFQGRLKNLIFPYSQTRKMSFPHPKEEEKCSKPQPVPQPLRSSHYLVQFTILTRHLRYTMRADRSGMKCGAFSFLEFILLMGSAFICSLFFFLLKMHLNFLPQVFSQTECVQA